MLHFCQKLNLARNVGHDMIFKRHFDTAEQSVAAENSVYQTAAVNQARLHCRTEALKCQFKVSY